MDAEDIVHDTIIECLKTDFEKIHNHRAWMTKLCSNKALDFLKSAQQKRNQYFGIWLPDLIPDKSNYFNNCFEPSYDMELSESLTVSFLILLQTLKPMERAIFLLKDVFGFSFQEISDLLEKRIDACRKIAERARKAIQNSKKDVTQSSSDSENLIREFFDAAKYGDKNRIKSLLSENSEFLSDGGGKVKSADYSSSKERIADFFAALNQSPIFDSANYSMEFTRVNFRPGLIIWKTNDLNIQEIETIMSFEIEDNQISRIFAQRNPDKFYFPRILSILFQKYSNLRDSFEQ